MTIENTLLHAALLCGMDEPDTEAHRLQIFLVANKHLSSTSTEEDFQACINSAVSPKELFSVAGGRGMYALTSRGISKARQLFPSAKALYNGQTGAEFKYHLRGQLDSVNLAVEGTAVKSRCTINGERISTAKEACRRLSKMLSLDLDPTDGSAVRVLRNLAVKHKFDLEITGRINDGADTQRPVSKLRNSTPSVKPTISGEEIAEAASDIDDDGAFEPESTTDARKHMIRLIAQRQGQPGFRKELLSAYKNRCAITDCDLEDALEAAHIVPYLGPDTNKVTNGLLLRADIHTLFDRGLITVDPETLAVMIAPSLKGTCYEFLSGTKLRLPDSRKARPSRNALRYHRQCSGI